jgi:hypothetical protein
LAAGARDVRLLLGQPVPLQQYHQRRLIAE